MHDGGRRVLSPLQQHYPTPSFPFATDNHVRVSGLNGRQLPSPVHQPCSSAPQNKMKNVTLKILNLFNTVSIASQHS